MFRRNKAREEGKRKRFPFLNEKGNVLVFYLFMFPIFIGGIGLAVDITNVASVRISLQASADAAVQGTVALSKNQTSGKPRFTSTSAAQKEAIRLYDANRSGMSKAGIEKEGIPFLQCQSKKSGSGTFVNPSQSKCGFTLTSFKYSNSGGLKNGGYVTMTVQEKADTMFLHALGFNDLTYTITSTARLTNTYK